MAKYNEYILEVNCVVNGSEKWLLASIKELGLKYTSTVSGIYGTFGTAIYLRFTSHKVRNNVMMAIANNAREMGWQSHRGPGGNLPIEFSKPMWEKRWIYITDKNDTYFMYMD